MGGDFFCLGDFGNNQFKHPVLKACANMARIEGFWKRKSPAKLTANSLQAVVILLGAICVRPTLPAHSQI